MSRPISRLTVRRLSPSQFDLFYAVPFDSTVVLFSNPRPPVKSFLYCYMTTTRPSRFKNFSQVFSLPKVLTFVPYFQRVFTRTKEHRHGLFNLLYKGHLTLNRKSWNWPQAWSKNLKAPFQSVFSNKSCQKLHGSINRSLRSGVKVAERDFRFRRTFNIQAFKKFYFRATFQRIVWIGPNEWWPLDGSQKWSNQRSANRSANQGQTKRWARGATWPRSEWRQSRKRYSTAQKPLTPAGWNLHRKSPLTLGPSCKFPIS